MKGVYTTKWTYQLALMGCTRDSNPVCGPAPVHGMNCCIVQLQLHYATVMHECVIAKGGVLYKHRCSLWLVMLGTT